MKQSFKDILEAMVRERISAGEDPLDLFEDLSREAKLVFGHYILEYELGLMLR
jgi:hypothetical protein